MRFWRLAAVLTITALQTLHSAEAQSVSVDAANVIDLRTPGRRAAAVQLLRDDAMQRRQQAQIRMLQAGGRVRGFTPSGAYYELVDFDDGQPVYLTTNNVNAAISTGADQIRNTAPYNLNGAGLTVGIWDGGYVRTTHQEFGGRVTAIDLSTLSNHATHVAGTIGAAGVSVNAMGMAPSIAIDSYDWDSDLAEMTSRAASLPLEAGKLPMSNHSYSIVCGWAYGNWSGSEGWHWLGTDGEREDRSFGLYSSTARSWDALCYDAPYYLPFKSAGNERNDAAPASGTTYYVYDGGWISHTYDPATGPYDDKYDNGGFDTIAPRGIAKNIITVGAVYDAVSAGQRDPAQAFMATFSAWGPADDGRVKPDLVANGIGLYSSIGTDDSSYASYDGTSMATPNALGSAALLAEYYQELFPGEALRASTMKALLIHTADDLGNAGPDYSFGWGLVNVKAAADQIQAHSTATDKQLIVEAQIESAVWDTYTFVSDGLSPIKATLCWTDPEGDAKSSLDDPTPVLVNDLELRISGPGGTPICEPFVLDPTNPAAAATTGDNFRDTVEQVLIESPPAGEYSLVVYHKYATLTNGLQEYGLIVSGQVLDDLNIAPDDSFSSAGKPGGPFSPTSETYTLSNSGSASLDWSAAAGEAWVDVSPPSGTLAAGGTVDVTVSLNAQAEALASGDYSASVTFTNLDSSFDIERTVSLDVYSVAALPFTDGFEAGPPLDRHWLVTGTEQYRTEIRTDYEPNNGTYHVIMDDSGGDTIYSRNELTLLIDLENRENVTLDFWAKGFSDESDGPPAIPFTDGADFDGVAISADGVSWYEVQGLRGLPLTYGAFSVDLDAVAATYGLTYNDLFRIRFNQYDNYGADSDGIAIDDVSITGDYIAPAITEVSSSTANGAYKADDEIAVTITFHEAVAVTGSPTLSLNADPGATAAYAGGSGTDTLTFTYTVTAGHTSADLDYSGTDALALNGGAIRDAATETTGAVLTLPSPGAAGSLGANKDIVVDTTAPSITVDSLLTNDTTPELSGAVSDATGVSSVEVVVNGQPYAATVLGGAWTAVVTNALSESVYEVGATATDVAGNAGSDATSNELTIDMTGPSVAFTSVAVSDSTPSLTVEVSDAAGVGSVTVTIDGDSYAATHGSGDSWTAQVTGALADGLYDLQADVADSLGNPGVEVFSDAVRIDTTAPVATLNETGANDSSPTLTGTITDGGAIDTFAIAVDGDVLTPAIVGSDWSVGVPGPLADGDYSVLLDSTDDLGNHGVTPAALTVDATPPDLTVNALLTNWEHPIVSGTFSDAHDADSVEVSVDGHDYAAVVGAGNPAFWTVTITHAIGEGGHDVAVTGWDSFGNDGSENAVGALSIDRTGPIPAIELQVYGKTHDEDIWVIVSFSEPVSSPPADLLEVTNAVVTDLFVQDSQHVACRVVALSEGLITAEVRADAVTDAADNGNAVSPMVSYTYEAAQPPAPPVPLWAMPTLFLLLALGIWRLGVYKVRS